MTTVWPQVHKTALEKMAAARLAVRIHSQATLV
jgi:hypothetical protein